MEDTFWITNRFGEKLEALVRKPFVCQSAGQSKPGGNNSFPAVIFVSGFGMDLHEYKNSFDEISKRFVDTGFLTLQFSFAGRGKSEGDYAKMTLERQADQIADVIAWLQVRSDVQEEHIGIIAQSFGSPTTMTYLTGFGFKRPGLSGTKGPAFIKAVCFVGGVYFLAQRFQTKAKQQRVAVRRDGITLFLDPFDNEIPIGPDFWKSIDAFNPKVAAAQVQLPALFIHGDQDHYITTVDATRIFDAIGSKEKQLKIISGGDHGIIDVPRSIREELLLFLVDWFNQRLNSNSKYL